MAKEKIQVNEPVPISNKKDTATFSFASPDEMQKQMMDIEINDTVTVTVSGKVTSYSAHNSNDWKDGSIGIDISSFKLVSQKDADNKSELDDMVEE